MISTAGSVRKRALVFGALFALLPLFTTVIARWNDDVAADATSDSSTELALGVEPPDGWCTVLTMIDGWGSAASAELALAYRYPDVIPSEKTQAHGGRVAVFRVIEDGRVDAAFKIVRGNAGWFLTQAAESSPCGHLHEAGGIHTE